MLGKLSVPGRPTNLDNDWLVGWLFWVKRPFETIFQSISGRLPKIWLVGFGFNGPLRQYFSLYRAVSQREGERGKKDR